MKKYVSLEEIKKKYNTSQATVYRWCRIGMPYVKLPNGKRVFNLADVKAWYYGNEVREGSIME